MTPGRFRTIFSISSEAREISYKKDTVLFEELPPLMSNGSPTSLYVVSLRTYKHLASAFSFLRIRLTFSWRTFTVTLTNPSVTYSVIFLIILPSQLVQLMPES